MEGELVRVEVRANAMAICPRPAGAASWFCSGLTREGGTMSVPPNSGVAADSDDAAAGWADDRQIPAAAGLIADTLTLPGRRQDARSARRFIARILNGRPCADSAVLLTSES